MDESDQAATIFRDCTINLRVDDALLRRLHPSGGIAVIPIEELADLGAFDAILGHLPFGLVTEIRIA
jgi:hypothetical protein